MNLINQIVSGTKNLARSTQLFSNTFLYYNKSLAHPERLLDLKQAWAKDVLTRLNIEVEPLPRSYPTNPGTLWLGNHISYLDIPLLLYHFPHLSFVAKAEVGRWPIIGPGAKHIGVIFVNRSDKESREQARSLIKEHLASGRDLVIFPSGTTRLKEDQPWRWGAFEIARDLGCWVQGFCLSYQPLRPAAYIDDDMLLPHMMKLMQRTKPIRASLILRQPFKVTDPIAASTKLQSWCRKQQNG